MRLNTQDNYYQKKKKKLATFDFQSSPLKEQSQVLLREEKGGLNIFKQIKRQVWSAQITKLLL